MRAILIAAAALLGAGTAAFAQLATAPAPGLSPSALPSRQAPASSPVATPTAPSYRSPTARSTMPLPVPGAAAPATATSAATPQPTRAVKAMNEAAQKEAIAREKRWDERMKRVEKSMCIGC